MLKYILHPVAISDADDPETFTIIMKYEDASKFLDEGKILERVQTSDKDLLKKIKQMVSKPEILKDFIYLNKDKLLFEVYPAEILIKFNLLGGLIIKGYGVEESIGEVVKQSC